MAVGATAVAATNIAQQKWIRPVTETILLPAHALLTRTIFNTGPDSLASSSVYINIDPELGLCGISDSSGVNNAIRIDNANPDISVNVIGSGWTAVPGGTSMGGSNSPGAQSIAVQSTSTNMAFLISFTATSDEANIVVSGTSVQNSFS